MKIGCVSFGEPIIATLIYDVILTLLIVIALMLTKHITTRLNSHGGTKAIAFMQRFHLIFVAFYFANLSIPLIVGCAGNLLTKLV